MAPGLIPRPGTDYGPCSEPCRHIDCQQTRHDAAAVCPHCRQPIGYDRPFYRQAGELAHASCAELAAEELTAANQDARRI